ncbi:hypothetical protein AB0L17_34305, partial [Streptomyces cellulosae]
MTPVELSRTVLHAVRRAVAEGELCVTVPERAVVVPPGPGGCGDYATSIALQLARSAGEPPRRVAEILRARLLDERRIADVVVTGPGFLNLSLESTASADLVEEILRRGQCYGHAAGPSGNSVLLRCPAEVRAVVVADALARVLRSQGDSVRVECDGRLDPRWESVLGADATVRGGGQATAGGNGSTTGEVHATGGHPIDVGDIPATGTSTGGTDSPGADAPTDASVTTDLNDTLSADTPTAGDNTPAADTPTDAGVTSTTSPTPQAPRPLTNHPVTFPPVPLRPVPAPTDP